MAGRRLTWVGSSQGPILSLQNNTFPNSTLPDAQGPGGVQPAKRDMKPVIVSKYGGLAERDSLRPLSFQIHCLKVCPVPFLSVTNLMTPSSIFVSRSVAKRASKAQQRTAFGLCCTFSCLKWVSRNGLVRGALMASFISMSVLCIFKLLSNKTHKKHHSVFYSLACIGQPYLCLNVERNCWKEWHKGGHD